MSDKRPKILVPPGIGDGFWVLVKMRAFIEARKLGRPEIWVHDSGPRRAEGMWRRFPLVDWGGYFELPHTTLGRAIQNRAYRTGWHAVQRRVFGFDYFVSMNGALEAGRTLDEAIPGATNWDEPLTGMDVTTRYASMYRDRFGEYVPVALWDKGFYKKWLAAFSEADVLATLRLIADAGKKIVLIGADWDRGNIQERMAAADSRFINFVGETTFDELTGLLAGAAAVFGFPAGNTLIAPRFRAPTTVLWTEHFPKTFWRWSAPPDPRFYQMADATKANPEGLAESVLALGSTSSGERMIA